MSNNSSSAASPPSTLASSAASGGIIHPSNIRQQQPSSALTAPRLATTEVATKSSNNSSPAAALANSGKAKQIYNTAYYDNLKTRLLSTTTNTRQETLRILMEVIETHPLMVTMMSDGHRHQKTPIAAVPSSPPGGKESATVAEYTTFLNALLPVFHSLLVSPASDTSIAFMEMGGKKGGGGSGGGKKKKKKQSNSSKEEEGGDVKDKGERKTKKDDDEKNKNAKNKKAVHDGAGGGNDNGAGETPSSSPFPPLDGAAASTTATAENANKNISDGGGNSTTKKSGGSSNNSKTPTVPACFIPPNSSTSSVDYQIRHLILSILTKLPSSSSSSKMTISAAASATTTTTSTSAASATASAGGRPPTSSSSPSSSTTTIIRPNHFLTILTISLHTLLEDYEPNALLAIQLLHKWHSHFGNVNNNNITTPTTTITTTGLASGGGGSSGNTKENAKLMKECQVFFDFVIRTFKDMAKANVVEGWLHPLFGVASSSSSGSTITAAATATTTITTTPADNVVEQPSLKSKQSLKVLAELPSIIKLLFQFHPKLYKSNAVSLLPALMEGLKLSAPTLPASSSGAIGGGGSGGSVIGASATFSSVGSSKSPPTSVTTATFTPSVGGGGEGGVPLPSSTSRMAPVPDPTRPTTVEDNTPTTATAATSTSPSLSKSTINKNNIQQQQQQQLSQYEIQKQSHYARTMELLNMQVRILAYVSSLVQKAFVTEQPAGDTTDSDFKSNKDHHHHYDPLPWASAATVSTLVRPHEEIVATLIIQLLRNCPREDAIIRKELLLCTRLILSISEFRAGFFRHVDNMLDERILVGCTTALVRGGGGGSSGGSSSGGGVGTGSTLELQSVIRPLGYAVLAEFLSLVRTKLTPAQLSRVIRIFSRLLHDTQTDVPISLQILSVRLLLSLCEMAYLSKDPNVQVGRDLLVRILMTVVQKFRTLKDKIPKIMDDAEREINVRVKWGDMVNKFMLDEKEEDRRDIFRVEDQFYSVLEDATFDGNYHGDPLFILRDIQSLLQPMILQMRNLFYYISTYSHHVEKEMRKSAGEDRYPLPLFVTNGDNDEVFSATLKLTQGEREIVAEFLLSGISCLKIFRMDVDPDEDPSLIKPYDEMNPSPKFREMCDAFAVSFTGLESHNFARIVAPNFSHILEEIDNDSALIGIFSSMLLDSRGVGKSHSYDLCAVLVPKILDNFDKLGEYEEVSSCKEEGFAGDHKAMHKGGAAAPTLQLTNRANTLFKILNLAISSLMKHSKNEEVFLPYLQKFTSECLKGLTRGPFLVPNPYPNILRSIFRTIASGKFEESYKELLPLISTILNELYRIYTLTNDHPFRLIVIELCLTLPTRLSVLLPHLPLLLIIIVPALQSNEGDLVNLALRTLEFWVDNLHPDYLFPIFAQQSSTLCDLMLALTHHLQPAPYPYGLLCLRLIGKLGGKNRLFLQEIMSQSCKANELIATHQLSLQCEWQSSPERNEMSDDEPQVSSSFLLPLPLDRAVEVLCLVATSPNIVKEGESRNVKSTPITDRNFSELLRQDAWCLDVQSVSIELMENAKKDQSNAAFTVIKGALASVLDVKDCDTLFIDCSDTCSREDEKLDLLLEEKDDNFSKDVLGDVESNTNTFKRICDGLFAATAHGELYEEAMELLKGVAAHVLLVVMSNEKYIIRIDSDGSTTDPFQSPDEYEACDHIDGKIKPLKPFGCFRLSGPFVGDINPFAFNEALVDAFSGGSNVAATEVTHFVVDMFQRIKSKIEESNIVDNKNCKTPDEDSCKSNSREARNDDLNNDNDSKDENDKSGDVPAKENAEKMQVDESRVTDSSSNVNLKGNSFGQILFEHLLSEFCLACSSKVWNARSGVMDGLLLLMRKMGVSWCKHFEVALLHAAIFVVKDSPLHVANACKESMTFFVQLTAFFYGSPSWEGSSVVYDILSPDLDCDIVPPSAEPLSISKASLTLVVAEIASSNALVRFAVRHFLRLVSNNFAALDKLLSDHTTSLKRLLFAKLLRTLSLPDLVAVVDAVAFINETVPNLIPISDPNMISFIGELIKMICIADGEISDKGFGSVVLIDKNGYAVNSDSEQIKDNKSLLQPSSVFLRQSITLEDKFVGARIVVPAEQSLGVQFRVSALFLFRAVVRLDEFFEAEVQSQMGNLRPHIVALLFRSLISESPAAVLISTSALKQALKLADDEGSADGASPKHKLSKELIQTCIRPILVNLRDHTKLSIPLLKGLSNLLTLLSSWFNKSLGDKMLEHLQRFLEPDKIIQLKLWRSGEEPLVAAAVMDLFSVLPQASNFVEALVKTTIRLESVLSAYGTSYVVSPFRFPLSRYLNRHCAGTVGFFLEEHRLSNPMYNDLLYDILKRDDSQPLRQYLGGKECTVMLLNVCFERPLAIIRSEKPSPTTKTGAVHLKAYGINHWYSPTAQRKLEIARQAIEMKKKILTAKQQEEAKCKKSLQSKGGDKKSSDYQSALKSHQSVRDAFERAKKEVDDAKNSYAKQIGLSFQQDCTKTRPMTTSALELQMQGFRLVEMLSQFDNEYLSQHTDVVRAMRWLWRSRGRHYRLLHEEEMPPRFHNESLMLSRFLVSYSKASPEDTDVLFDLIRIFLQPFASVDFSFIKDFLVERMVNVLTLNQKSQVIQRFLALLSGDGSEETKVLSCQILIMPTLKQGDPKEVFCDAYVRLFVKLLLKDGAIFGSKLTCELLHLIMILLEQMQVEIVEYQKDILKYIWGILKMDNVNTKYVGYLAVSKFVAAFETPPKVILQVYRSLLRSHSSVERRNVREAMSVLLPNLPLRLGGHDLEIALKYTIKVMHEEEDSLPQTSHLWGAITRHSQVFEQFKVTIMPFMKHAVTLIGSHLHSHPEYRWLSVCLAQLMIEWTEGGIRSLDQNIADALVNILVRIALFNAESKPNRVRHRVRVQALTLLQSIISCRENCNIDPTHFHKTTFALLSSNSKERTEARDRNDSLPGKDANDDDLQKISILNVCIHIFSMLQRHDPTNAFLESNFCKILSRCFCLVTSTNDSKLSTMIENIVTRMLTDGTASSALISNVTVAVDNRIIESSSNNTNDGAFLAVSIVDKVTKIDEVHGEPFLGSLQVFLVKKVKEHLKEIEDEKSTNATLLMKQGKGHQLSATPTSGIFGAACGLHFKDSGSSSKDVQTNDIDPRNQLTIKGENLSAEIRALVSCVMLIGSGEGAIRNNHRRKVFIEILLALLNSSNSLPVLMAVVSIMAKWLLENDKQAFLKKSERSSLLSGIARFNFERLPEMEARCLSDQICCFVLSAYGYNQSVIQNYPFGLERNQPAGIRVPADCDLIGEEAFQKILIACLLSSNRCIRSLCTAIFCMRSTDCILVHEKLSKLAIERGCRTKDCIDVAGLPCRGPGDILRRLLCSDFECLGGRLWTTVILDVLLAVANHQGGVRARALGNVHDKEVAFASFMRLEGGGERVQGNTITLRFSDFDDGLYSSFIEAVSVERNEQLCGKGRCIAAVRQMIHGDAMTFQSLFELCVEKAWRNLPSDTVRTSLIRPLEALLAKPYHSQFTNANNLPKINCIQSMLRLLVKLRPIPVLDTFLLQSLSTDYNAVYEVLTYFECEYDALRKNEVDVVSSPYDLIRAIRRCYDALGERDVCLSISSAISSTPTKFALSLDKYGFVNETVDAYEALLETVGDNESLLPPEDELHIWEERWVESHKEMSQWSLIDEFASSHNEARLCLEAAWKTKNWEKVKSLSATPSVLALLEEGDQHAKMTEMFLAIQEGNIDAVESIHTQIAQLCLYRWNLLPSISSGSQAHQGLLQQCTRLVELRESSQLMVDTNAHISMQTVPDVKTLLTAWKHRSPNLFEPISQWEDLFLWRSNIFDAIAANFAWVEPSALSTLHDRPHCCISLSRVARKQDLKEVSTFTLDNLGDSVMDVDNAFLKLRERLTAYQYSSENVLKGGLNLVNSTNISYFNDRQKAELFRLKAYFLNELRDKPKANQAYCQAVQICPNHARAWQDWGDLCVSLSDATQKLAEGKAEKKDLAKKASQYLSQAAGCYLEALRVDTSEQCRDRIPHCLSMLAADGRQYGSICRTLEARGASTPAWCWLPWIPQLLSSLCRVEARAVKPILIGILKDHPQALYYSLRSFFLERRDVEKSGSGQNSDDTGKNENDPHSSLKFAEIIMSSLRKTHPVLWNRLEVILDNLIVRFRPSYEAELLQTIIALIKRASKAEEKVNDNSNDDSNEEEKQMEYYEKTLSRIGEKFFGKSTSLSKKALHFQSRYGSLFENDFGQSIFGSFKDLLEKLKKWKSLLERQVSRVPTKCKLSETSPALSWFSSQAPDLWSGACNSKSLSSSNSRQDSLSLPPFYDAARSSAIQAARASSQAVLLAAQSEGLDGCAGGGAAAVEIPGQYAPTSTSVFDSRPTPEIHAKLVRFKQILEVTSTGSTNQHVHRITMIGSDGKEYKFILQLASPYSTRTDERSAQIQFIMGKTLRGDIRACRRGLVVRPNVVIPLAQRMRMSATEDSHQSLESILNIVHQPMPDIPTHFQKAVDERLSTLIGVDDDVRSSAEKDVKLDVYTEICRQISSNTFSNYMIQIFPSTESLCQFRKEFASQLAVNSVLQYALAVVERTPSRLVFCNKTGQVLAHDMRSAYNHGLLEKQAIPFRLTRNITEFIGPFLLDGVFVPSFVSVCGAMSSRRNVLEPMIHILLRDDVISWYTSKTSAANDKKTQEIELQLSDRVRKNVRFVQQCFDSCAPKRVENIAEAIKENSDPIDTKVRTLVDAACSAERLSSMPASYHAWL